MGRAVDHSAALPSAGEAEPRACWPLPDGRRGAGVRGRESRNIEYTFRRPSGNERGSILGEGEGRVPGAGATFVKGKT